MNYFTIF